MRTITFIIITIIVSGCTWVKISPSGEKVRVLELSEVSTCQKKGESTVSLMAKIAGIDRNQAKVKKELQTLARNTAADMNGDTIVATSEIVDGKQTYAVYQCVGLR